MFRRTHICCELQDVQLCLKYNNAFMTSIINRAAYHHQSLKSLLLDNPSQNDELVAEDAIVLDQRGLRNRVCRMRLSVRAIRGGDFEGTQKR